MNIFAPRSPFFEHLRIVRRGGAMALKPRETIEAALKSFHSNTLSCEWGGSYYPHVPHCAWWQVPGEDGIVLHSMSWAPRLLDYGAVARHDTSTLDGWTIDGDYLSKNIGDGRSTHVVQDSDEMFLASWAPMDERASVFRPFRFFQSPLGKRLAWSMACSSGRASTAVCSTRSSAGSSFCRFAGTPGLLLPPPAEMGRSTDKSMDPPISPDAQTKALRNVLVLAGWQRNRARAWLRYAPEGTAGS